jgi:hypothetical protein
MTEGETSQRKCHNMKAFYCLRAELFHSLCLYVLPCRTNIDRVYEL